MDQDEMDIDEFNHEIEDEIQVNIMHFPDDLSNWIMIPVPPLVDSRLARLLKAVPCFIRSSAREIAESNHKVIQEVCERIQNVLLCIPAGDMRIDVNNAYLKLLDSLADVHFPVTSLVNHVIVVGLRQATTIPEYFSDIIYPNNTFKLSYFLKHAHDPQHGLSLKGFRLSDFLLADYFRHDCPRALLEILRYGCSDLLKKKCFHMKRHNWKDVGCTRISEYKLLDTLQYFLSLQPYMGPMTEKELQAKTDCLKVIFRSIYMFTFEQLYAISEFAESLEHFKDYGLTLLTRTDRFPELNERIGKVAPRLKHMCRFQIRKILYENWALPHGIWTLAIPVCLQEYLDLKTD